MPSLVGGEVHAYEDGVSLDLGGDCRQHMKKERLFGSEYW